jgi:dipeptidyl aminopeptidase/acylaminoacyl peptidase
MSIFYAGLDGVTFQSGGRNLLGGFYRAAGQGPRPTALLLHGLPGVEKNLDIAYGLRDAGWNCLYFHYRGSWGSEGAYSLEGLYDDLLAASGRLKREPCVDNERLALVGHSVGGYLALMAGAMDSYFRAIVSLCPLLSPIRAPLSLEMFDEFAQMLNSVTGKELQSQWENLPPLESKADQLHNRPVLIMTGRKDDIFPPHHYRPLMEAVPTIEWYEFPDGDHSLSLCRQEAVRRTLDWLFTYVGQ